jgi:hypothetical protein
MRNLGAMVAALSLGACASQPPILADVVAQIRSDFGAGNQSCADRSPTRPGQNLAQAKCFTGNPVALSKPILQTAETRAKQRVASDHPTGFNAHEPALPPKLASANEAAVESVPALNSEANCHLADTLVVNENLNRCLLVEASARDELAHRWVEFPSADRSHCTRYTTAGGGGTYTGLLTCLEMEMHVRNLPAKNKSVANQ